MENKKTVERILAYSLATDIEIDDLQKVAGGGARTATQNPSSKDTMFGRDHTYDTEPDR